MEKGDWLVHWTCYTLNDYVWIVFWLDSCGQGRDRSLPSYSPRLHRSKQLQVIRATERKNNNALTIFISTANMSQVCGLLISSLLTTTFNRTISMLCDMLQGTYPISDTHVLCDRKANWSFQKYKPITWRGSTLLLFLNWYVYFVAARLSSGVYLFLRFLILRTHAYTGEPKNNDYIQTGN